MNLSPQRTLGVAVAISAMAHLLVVVAARTSGEEEAPEASPVDIDIAPEAPEAFEPEEPESLPEAEVPAPAPEEPVEAGEPEVADEGDIAADAGVPDAGIPDAGVSADAGAPDAGPPPDGGPDGFELDAGTQPLIASSGDAGPSVAGGPSSDAGPPQGDPDAPAWARVPLAGHAPPGDRLRVMLRFDQIRDTEWNDRALAILEPMPDYQMIVGDDGRNITEVFDFLFITSSDPRDVAATNLAAKSNLPRKALQAYLKRSGVSWTTVTGGALGRRARRPTTPIRDNRVYLIPSDPWIALADPKHLTGLTQPTAGDIGTARAPIEHLPGWLRYLDALDQATSGDSASMLLLSMDVKRSKLPVMGLGTLPGPDSFVLSVEVVDRGFLVRGLATFDTAKSAEKFVQVASTMKEAARTSWKTRMLLQNMHVLNAAQGLSMKRKDNRVSIATSISIADARAGLTFAADWSRRFFEAARNRDDK